VGGYRETAWWILVGTAAGAIAGVLIGGIGGRPQLLSISLFVALPGVAAALVVLLVERWIGEPPWRDRRLSMLVVVAAIASTFALDAAALAGVAAFFVRRLAARERLRRIGRVVVPVGPAAVALVSGIDLVAGSARILR
jgi:hypothetical protein